MKQISHDFQPSHLPAEWGGPFVWIRHSNGHLVLTKIKDIANDMQEMLAMIREAGRR